MSFFPVSVPRMTCAFCFLLSGHGRERDVLVDQFLATLFSITVSFTALSFPALSLLFSWTSLRGVCFLGTTRVRIAKDPISRVFPFLSVGKAGRRWVSFRLSSLSFRLFSFSSLSAFLVFPRGRRTLARPLSFVLPLIYAGA